MAERTFGIEFSNYFSKERGPNRVLTPLKSTSKTSSQTFVGLPKSSFGERNLAKLLQNIIASQKSNISHVATIVASKKVALSGLGRKWYENVDKNLR
jgi:hypothetical protein